MNIEQKAKAYDKALDDIRAIYPNLKGDAKLAVEHAFPELAESEDERTRTRLLEYFHGFKDSAECPVFWEGLNIDNILTWLEKQKEQKPTDEQFPPLEGLDAIKAKYYDDGFKNGFDEGVESVKPAEWSEEEERMLRTIISDGSRGVELDSKQIQWLKSLRPQPHWKPSEEQMELTEGIYAISEGYKAFTIDKGTKVQIVKRKAKPTYQGNRCRDCIYCVRGTYLFSQNQWWESECCKKKQKTVGGQSKYFYGTKPNKHACEMFERKEESK